MKTHYDHYLLGCRQDGTRPVGFWRFSVAYGRYLRDLRERLDQPWDGLSPQERRRFIRVRRFAGLAGLVRQGEQIAQAARRRDGDEPGAATAGVRAPRTPWMPVLAGHAARALPTGDVDEKHGWRF